MAIPDDELGAQLVDALARLEAVADEVTPDDAVGVLDEVSLQVFWRDWPQLSSWAGALWRRVNADLAAPARPSDGSELDEIGGG